MRDLTAATTTTDDDEIRNLVVVERAATLVPSNRRGFVNSLVLIAVLVPVLATQDLAGALTWGVIRLLVTCTGWWVLHREGDGRRDPRRSILIVRVAGGVSAVAWGSLPFLVRLDSDGLQSLLLFAALGNAALLAIMCAGDRVTFVIAAIPTVVLSTVAAIFVLDHPSVPIAIVCLIMGPYAYSIVTRSDVIFSAAVESDIRSRRIADELARRQAELRVVNERLSESLQMQSLAATERSGLIAALGHDLASPLTTISIDAQRLATSNDERTQRLASRIASSATSAASVLRDLTDSRRLSSADVEPRLETIDVANLVAGVLADDRSERVSVAAIDRGITVRGDPVLLARVLHNLVSNATKYAGEGAMVSIGCRREGDSTLLWVEDTGPGLPSDLVDAVFEPYVRASADPDVPGDGIGLYLVRTFVEVQGGRVWAEPVPSGGVRFVVSLPG